MMNRAFTLIELLISFTILSVISGGALVYLNKYNAKQNLDKSTEEVINYVKLAQSYAKTRQFPPGNTGTNLRYIQVSVGSNGNIVALANGGVGSSFYNSTVCKNNNTIAVGTSPPVLYFWGGSGFLAKSTSGNMFSGDEKAKIYIQSSNDVEGYNVVEINSLGQIETNAYFDGEASFSFPCIPAVVTPSSVPTITNAPTTTNAPTSTRTPTATPTGVSCGGVGTVCSVHSGCCSYYCNPSKICQLATPTPTSSCKQVGTACSVHANCCSYYCSVGLCI